jgi:hypothetical protein
VHGVELPDVARVEEAVGVKPLVRLHGVAKILAGHGRRPDPHLARWERQCARVPPGAVDVFQLDGDARHDYVVVRDRADLCRAVALGDVWKHGAQPCQCRRRDRGRASRYTHQVGTKQPRNLVSRLAPRREGWGGMWGKRQGVIELWNKKN